MAKKPPSRSWCYYCDTRFEDDLNLLRHQRAKHFMCRICDPKEYAKNCLSLGGLINHVKRTHKTELEEVHGAIPGRKSVSVEVLGMKGIPDEALKEFEKLLAEDNEKAMWAGDSTPAPIASEVHEDNAIKEVLYSRKPRAVGRQDAEEPKRAEPYRPPSSRGLLPGTLGSSPMPGWAPSQVQAAFPELAILAKNLANQLTQENAEEEPKKTKINDMPAFDPSLLAKRIAAGEGKDPETEERLRQEEEERAEAVQKSKMETAKIEEQIRAQEKAAAAPRFGFKMTFAKEEPKVKVDKSVVEGFGVAAAAAAATAQAAAAAAKAAKPRVIPLSEKLAAMERQDVLKYASEVGCDADEVFIAQDIKDALIQLVLDLETKESWTTVTFKPGRLGIKAHWPTAKVKKVIPGAQGSSNNIKVGMVFVTIEGKKFNKLLLKQKIAGGKDYKVIFATKPEEKRALVEQPPSEYEYSYYSDDNDSQEDASAQQPKEFWNGSIGKGKGKKGQDSVHIPDTNLKKDLAYQWNQQRLGNGEEDTGPEPQGRRKRRMEEVTEGHKERIADLDKRISGITAIGEPHGGRRRFQEAAEGSKDGAEDVAEVQARRRRRFQEAAEGSREGTADDAPVEPHGRRVSRRFQESAEGYAADVAEVEEPPVRRRRTNEAAEGYRESAADVEETHGRRRRRNLEATEAYRESIAEDALESHGRRRRNMEYTEEYREDATDFADAGEAHSRRRRRERRDAYPEDEYESRRGYDRADLRDNIEEQGYYEEERPRSTREERQRASGVHRDEPRSRGNNGRRGGNRSRRDREGVEYGREDDDLAATDDPYYQPDNTREASYDPEEIVVP